jgi:fatty acid desaturase
MVAHYRVRSPDSELRVWFLPYSGAKSDVPELAQRAGGLDHCVTTRTSYLSAVASCIINSSKGLCWQYKCFHKAYLYTGLLHHLNVQIYPCVQNTTGNEAIAWRQNSTQTLNILRLIKVVLFEASPHITHWKFSRVPRLQLSRRLRLCSLEG